MFDSLSTVHLIQFTSVFVVVLVCQCCDMISIGVRFISVYYSDSIMTIVNYVVVRG